MSEANTVGFLIARAFFEHRKLAGQLLEDSGIHSGQPPLLFALMNRDGLTNNELSQKLEVSPATITNMVKRMESAGFVTRQRDPADDRVIRVYLTGKGQEVWGEIEKTMQIIEGIAFKDFSAEEKSLLRQLLLRVLENVRDAQESSPSFAVSAHERERLCRS